VIEPPPAVPPASAAPPAIPALAPAQILPASRARPTATRRLPGSAKWVLAAAAILLASIVAFGLHPKPDARQASAAAPALLPLDPKPVAAPPVTSPPAPAQVPAVPSGNWRVIAFTYHSPALAEKKAHQINQRWPDLHAALFAPKASRGYYLIALGPRMDREEAIRLQQTRAAGACRAIPISKTTTNKSWARS
jgi:hypothetical protein